MNQAVASGGYDQPQSNGGGYDDYGGNGGDYGGSHDVGGFLDGDEGAPPPEKPKEVYVPEDILDDQLFEFQINSGINFEKYDSIPVNVSSTNKRFYRLNNAHHQHILLCCDTGFCLPLYAH